MIFVPKTGKVSRKFSFSICGAPMPSAMRKPVRNLMKMFTRSLRESAWIQETNQALESWLTIRFTRQVQSSNLSAWNHCTYPLTFDDIWSPINYSEGLQEEGQPFPLLTTGFTPRVTLNATSPRPSPAAWVKSSWRQHRDSKDLQQNVPIWNLLHSLHCVFCHVTALLQNSGNRQQCVLPHD